MKTKNEESRLAEFGDEPAGNTCKTGTDLSTQEVINAPANPDQKWYSGNPILEKVIENSPEIEPEIKKVVDNLSSIPVSERKIPRKYYLDWLGIFATDERVEKLNSLFENPPFYFTVVDL